MYTYISDTSHFKEVLSRVLSVKHLLWIGTADIKDLYVDVANEKKPFLSLIAQLIRRGVKVRLIHAKEPGPNFREDFESTQCCMTAWSVCFVRVFISRCLSLMARKCMLEVRTSRVRELA